MVLLELRVQRHLHHPRETAREHVGGHPLDRLGNEHPVMEHPQAAAALGDQQVAPRQEGQRPWVRQAARHRHDPHVGDLVGVDDERLGGNLHTAGSPVVRRRDAARSAVAGSASASSGHSAPCSIQRRIRAFCSSLRSRPAL